MNQELIPFSLMVRPIVSIPRISKRPKLPVGKKLHDQLQVLPPLGREAQFDPPMEIRAGWHQNGLLIILHVSQKQQPVCWNTDHPDQQDRWELWIDTRCTQDVHRATAYCHRVSILPPHEDEELAVIKLVRIPNAKSDAPQAASEDFLVQAKSTDDGYRIDCWFPAETLNGYDPKSVDTIGFFYALYDQELGNFFWRLDEQFPVDYDPSLWGQLYFQS